MGYLRVDLDSLRCCMYFTKLCNMNRRREQTEEKLSCTRLEGRVLRVSLCSLSIIDSILYHIGVLSKASFLTLQLQLYLILTACLLSSCINGRIHNNKKTMKKKVVRNTVTWNMIPFHMRLHAFSNNKKNLTVYIPET